jgi:hypothetical protein
MIIDNSCLSLANTQDERFTPFLVIKMIKGLLTFGLGIIILQGISRRKSLAGVNIMCALFWHQTRWNMAFIVFCNESLQMLWERGLNIELNG